jgi:recombinational DNA repair ATPase RecF
MQYLPSLPADSRDLIFQRFEKLLQSEIMYKRTLAGPHLDNFDFRLDGKQLKLYSSGEKKINLLMIYIAFIELFKKFRNDYPVFLVDDFDTAMDTGNINFLIDNYPDLQVIATSVNERSGFDRSIELMKEC